MPRRRTSLKSKRQDKKRHLRNLKIKQELKKTIKKFQAFLLDKKIDEAREILKKVFSLLDKASKKRIIPLQRANRRKSRLSIQLRRLSA